MGNTKGTFPPNPNDPGHLTRADPATARRVRPGPSKRLAEPPLPEPYAMRLEGLLQFHDLASAEESLHQLDTAYGEYRQQSDQTGMRLVRSLALKGKQRAGSIARNPRVNAFKRQEKQEISDWFRIWLQSPGLLFGWLELRKGTSEFQARFNARPEARSEGDSKQNTEDL